MFKKKIKGVRANYLAIPYRQLKPEASQYNTNHFQNVDEKIINFIYDDSIDRMREIKDDDKVISSRATLLLGYLATIVTGLLIILFGDIELSIQIGQATKDFLWILLVIYPIEIFLVVVTLMNPNFLAYAHSQPKFIMEDMKPQMELRGIKVLYIYALQDNIEFNTERLYIRASWLRFCMLFTFLAPLVVFGTLLAFDFIQELMLIYI